MTKRTFSDSVVQHKTGTAAQWTSANPTLAKGEIGVEIDTYKLKIGDGVTAWNSLSYITAANATGLQAVYYITPGTYTWTCPAGITMILVTVIGAGGGGAGGSYVNTGWGGGGANIIRDYPCVVTPETNYTIVVGNGGSGGTNTTGNNTGINAGSSGGQSSFGSLVATGGAGGGQSSGYGAFLLSSGTILNNGTSDGVGGGQFGGTKAMANNNSASIGGIGSGGGAGYSNTKESKRTNGGNGGPGMVFLMY